MHNGCKLTGHGWFVCDLGWVGVNGVDLHSHRELAQIAVEQNATAWSYLESALLLLCCSLNVGGVLNNLQPEEPHKNGEHPCAEEETENQEPDALEGNYLGRIAASTNGSKGSLCLCGGRQLSAPN